MANLSKWNPFNFISDSGPERFAVGRVNILLARIFAIGGLAVGLQMLLNDCIKKRDYTTYNKTVLRIR